MSGTAALLLWDWGKGCGFLAVKGWRDLRWTVARFCGNVAPFAAGPTTDNDYSPTKQSVGSFNTKLYNISYCLDKNTFDHPRFPDICLRAWNKSERHDAKFHDGLAIKDVKATCHTTAAQKSVGRTQSQSRLIKCLLIGQYLANNYLLPIRKDARLLVTQHWPKWPNRAWSLLEGSSYEPEGPSGATSQKSTPCTGAQSRGRGPTQKTDNTDKGCTSPHLNGPFSLT